MFCSTLNMNYLKTGGGIVKSGESNITLTNVLLANNSVISMTNSILAKNKALVVC